MKPLDYIHLDPAEVNNVVMSLQQLLADFQVHYTNLRSYHWNIKGRDFFVLHEKFEELYMDAAKKIDEIAERILMLEGTPRSKFSDYLSMTNVTEIDGVKHGEEAINHILSTYTHLISEERKLAELAGKIGDEVTQAMMSDYLRDQEKMVWMLTAFSQKD